MSDLAPTSRYVSLATLTVDGRPSVRTVVYRGQYEGKLQVATDVRSGKIAGLRRHCWAEICWYFTVGGRPAALACASL